MALSVVEYFADAPLQCSEAPTQRRVLGLQRTQSVKISTFGLVEIPPAQAKLRPNSSFGGPARRFRWHGPNSITALPRARVLAVVCC